METEIEKSVGTKVRPDEFTIIENKNICELGSAQLSHSERSPVEILKQGNKGPSTENSRRSQAGVYGKFTVTKDISQYSRAKLFNAVGKQTPIFIRFSTLSADETIARTERYLKEFAVKFLTEDGEWDIVGNSTPVLLANDVITQIDFLKVPRRDPKTNLKDPTMAWDFISKNPESLHQVIMLMSDRGTPRGYKYTDGFGTHTFSMINAEKEKVWVKFHFKTVRGVKTYTLEEAALKHSEDNEYPERDLIQSIEKKDFPKWMLCIQVMSDEQAKTLHFNPFDVTKTWSQKHFPLKEVGILEVDRLPENYETEVENSYFGITNIIDGISFSPDKILQSKLQEHNRVSNMQLNVDLKLMSLNKDRKRTDGKLINGWENNLLKKSSLLSYNSSCSTAEGYYDYYTSNRADNYSQPGVLFRNVMSEPERANLISNIVTSMIQIKGPESEFIISRQMHHWFNIDKELGFGIAKGLGLDKKYFLSKMP
jgi:catalase